MKNITSFKEFKLIKEDKEFTNDTTWKNSLLGKGIANLFTGASKLIKAIFGRNLSGFAKKIDREYLKGVILWCVMNNVSLTTGEYSATPTSSGQTGISDTTNEPTDEPTDDTTQVQTQDTGEKSAADVEEDPKLKEEIENIKTEKYKKAINTFYKKIENATKETLVASYNKKSADEPLIIITSDDKYKKILADKHAELDRNNMTLDEIDTKLLPYNKQNIKKSTELAGKGGDEKFRKFLEDGKKLKAQESELKTDIAENNDEISFYEVLRAKVGGLYKKFGIDTKELDNKTPLDDKKTDVKDKEQKEPQAQDNKKYTDEELSKNQPKAETEEEYQKRIKAEQENKNKKPDIKNESLDSLTISELFDFEDDFEDDEELYESVKVRKLFYRKNWKARVNNFINRYTEMNFGNNINKEALKNELPADIQELTIDKINLVEIEKTMKGIDDGTITGKKPSGTTEQPAAQPAVQPTSDSFNHDNGSAKVFEAADTKKLSCRESATLLVDVNAVYANQLSAEMLYSDEDGRANKRGENTWKKKIMGVRSKYKGVLVVDKIDPTSSSFILDEEKRKAVAGENKDALADKQSSVETSIEVANQIERFDLDENATSGKQLIASAARTEYYMVTLNWGKRKSKTPNPNNKVSMAVRCYDLDANYCALAVNQTYDKEFMKKYDKTKPINVVPDNIFTTYVRGKETIPPTTENPKITYLVFEKAKFKLPTTESDDILNVAYVFTTFGEALYASELSTVLKEPSKSVGIDSQVKKTDRENLESNKMVVRMYKVFKMNDVTKLVPTAMNGSRIKKFTAKLTEFFKKINDKTIK